MGKGNHGHLEMFKRTTTRLLDRLVVALLGPSPAQVTREILGELVYCEVNKFVSYLSFLEKTMEKNKMGFEVRMIKPGWEHPKEGYEGKYIPLFPGEMYQTEIKDFQDDVEEFGLEETLNKWDGRGPDKKNYMPVWEPGEASLYVMYEDVSEGTPISPPFSTKEELADWLSKYCTWGTYSYDMWLATVKRGYAMSAVFTPEIGFQHGVVGEYMLEQLDAEREEENK